MNKAVFTVKVTLNDKEYTAYISRTDDSYLEITHSVTFSSKYNLDGLLNNP